MYNTHELTMSAANAMQEYYRDVMMCYWLDQLFLLIGVHANATVSIHTPRERVWVTYLICW